MAKKKKVLITDFHETQDWLFKLVSSAPRPLPPGRFPVLLAESEAEGYSRDVLMDVVDLWLNYGYCRVLDAISTDIELTPAGEAYFY